MDEIPEIVLESSPTAAVTEGQPSHHPDQNQDYELTHPNIPLIEELLEYMKGTNMKI